MQIVVEIHNAVRTRVQRLGRADFNTGCVLTVIAAHDGKHPARIGELPFSTYLTQVRLTPMGHHAQIYKQPCSVAADAVAIVDDESKIQKCLLRKCTLCNNAFDQKF